MRCLVVVIILLLVATIRLPSVYADYSGRALHRHPSLRQFWREVEEDLEEEIEELEPSWLRQRHLSGAILGEHRDTLSSWGIMPTLTYVSNILGNPIGGRQRKIAYDDNIGLDVHMDMEQLAGFYGLVFHVSGVMRSGRNLSSEAIGNTFPVSSLFGGETIRLYALYVEQSFLEDMVSLQLGRFGVGDEFLTSSLYSVFLSNTINGNPISAPLNIPTFSSSSYPVAQWGIRTIFRPAPDWYLMAATTNGDQKVARTSAHGVDFSLRHSASLFAIGEIGYLPHQEEQAVGLPGNYKFGGYYDSGRFADLYRDRIGSSFVRSGLPPRRTHNNYGFYLLVDQEVYREDDEKHVQGLTPFVGMTFAPAAINTFSFFLISGMVYNGPIPGRDRDTLGFNFAYGPFSHDLQRSQHFQRQQEGATIGVQDFEIVLELTYQYELAPHLIVQPDLQYIVQPGGTGHIPDAFVLGVQIAINL